MGPSVTVTPFTELPPDRDKPRRAEGTAVFTLPDGSALQAKVSLFMLEDGRIGAAVYPDPAHGAVLRWDDGPQADPRVIYWEAPHCADDECDSPCGHRQS